MRGLKRVQGTPNLELLLRDGVATGLTDQELLERFAENRDSSGELAFTTLVARHGPMVLSVCRRILPNPADVDDAFQATFLVLVRRAGSVRFRTSLGPWLYGVSIRVARRIRDVGLRRSGAGTDGETLEAIPDPRAGILSNVDLRLAIDEGLDHLPDGYRSAVVLCHLEGLTHEEAADRLECPVGTVRSRLARGRALLRGHLERLGLGPPTGISKPVPRANRDGALPIVAAHLIETTAQAAARLAAGQPLAETLSTRLAGIVAGVTRSMMISKITLSLSLFAVTILAAWGVSVGLAAPQTPAPGTFVEPAPSTGSLLLAAAQDPSDRAKKASRPAPEDKAKVDPA